MEHLPHQGRLETGVHLNPTPTEGPTIENSTTPVLIHMNSYIFHICFILFILLSYLIFDYVCLMISSADTHGIAKYARTYSEVKIAFSIARKEIM